MQEGLQGKVPLSSASNYTPASFEERCPGFNSWLQHSRHLVLDSVSGAPLMYEATPPPPVPFPPYTPKRRQLRKLATDGGGRQGAEGDARGVVDESSGPEAGCDAAGAGQVMRAGQQRVCGTKAGVAEGAQQQQQQQQQQPVWVRDQEKEQQMFKLYVEGAMMMTEVA